MKAKLLALAALVLGLASCQTDPEGINVDANGEAAVTISVGIPDTDTRAGGGDSAVGAFGNVDFSKYDVRYILEVYNLEGQFKDELAKERMVKIEKDGSKNTSFTLRLIPGRDYRFVVWADIVEEGKETDLHYVTTDLKDIEFTNLLWNLSDETRDAYTNIYDVTDFSSSSSVAITLKRPLGKLRVVTTDIKDMFNVLPEEVTVLYTSSLYTKFNAFTSQVVSDSKAYALKTKTIKISENKYANEWDGDKVKENLTLFADYYFAANEQEPITFTLDVKDNIGMKIPQVVFNTPIPIQRNYLTTVMGPVLTDANSITVTVNDAFENGTNWNPEEDEFDVEIWDGKTLTEPKQDAEGNYVVNLASELAWLAAAVNGTLETRATVAPQTFQGKTFKLTQDIDLDFNEWTPIGNSTNKFQGTFDGQGHKIANLRITGNNSYVGLFGFTTNGEIKNLVVENAKVSGYVGVGVVAGSPYTSKFNDITVQGHVEVNGMAYVGGVGGRNAYASWNNVTVNVDETSYVNANSIEGSTAYRTYVGGVCGFNGEGGHSFKNITSNIDVKGSTIDVGGLFGIAHYGNQFENCSCSGDVEIYAAEEAEEAQEIGGIAGVWNNGGADVVFTNCTFTGTLKTNIAVDFYNGGLVGKPYSATGKGKLIIDGYEVIADGVGMKDGEYYVMSAQGLAWVEAQEDKYFAGKTIKLANNIDMTGVTIEKPIHFWNGRTTFDGQNYTISNLTMSTTSTEKKPFGLFGGTADIKNVKFDKANISGYSYVAVVAGNLYGNIDNCHVSNSSVTCTYWMAGAMSGQYNAGNVTNCSVTNTTITGPAAVGALVGNINETAGERKVENCTVTGCTVAQNGSFGGDYDKMFGTAVGLVNINNSKVYINGCTVEDTTVKGASANIFGHNGGDNTTIYVDGYIYTPDGIIEDENGNLVVNSLDTLENALKTAGAAGAGDTTIVFAENTNINMTNAEWTPIKVDGYHGADIVTIEGNGAVITGLTAPLFAGGFAGGSGIVIKDLTIKDSNIVSANTIGSGAFIESVDSMAKIELTNCHLLNSTVTGGAGSRTGGLIGWTAGYNNVNDGPVKTYVTIDNCSVVGCTIQCDGSVGGINGHAGNNAWTYTTIKNCTIENNTLNSTDDGGWRVGVVVGTANVGEVTISNITESGNTLTQTGKTAPEGYLRNYYGRAVLGDTGKLIIEGNEYVAEGLLKNEDGDQIAYSEAGLKEALENGGTVVLANPFTIDQSDSNGYGKTGINMIHGGTLDGNGNELGAPGSTGTWDSAINTSGGTIKNIKVTEGFRGIFIKKDDNHNEKLYLDNVTIDGTTYTISCDSGNGLGLEATNSTFKGWTSYAGTLGNAKFTDCYFGYGNGYSFCRPYAPTEFVGCEFEAGLTLDPRADVTFENCTLNGVALTSANIAELVTDTAKVTIK